MSLIQLQGLSLVFPHKTCFAQFDATLQWGQRLAIVGDNGSGKSSLLRMLYGSLAPSEGRVIVTPGARIGYLAQVLDGADGLSGGQRVNQALTQALAAAPDLLLLDEPTNHLDAANRRSLARKLKDYYGTLVLVTHDEALMDQLCDDLWVIEQEQIATFSGRYADYQREQAQRREALYQQISAVKRAQQDAHASLMQEQERASHARQRGIKHIQERRWATVKSPTKLGRGNTTAVNQQAEIRQQQRELTEQLASLRPADVIVPQFHLRPSAKSRSTVLQISGAAVGCERPLLENLHLSLAQGERLALVGDNGSGKSTLARAICGEQPLRWGGDWITPRAEDIGYLDQHYANLMPQHTVLQALAHVAPDWAPLALRRHLSDFLFRHDEAVQTPVAALSGGERARLSLACIAAKTPQLLILDEVTNNLDRRTRTHVADVLRNYPGAMLLISHDEGFLAEVAVTQSYVLVDAKVK